MKNITVSVDTETYRLARIRAAELDTSVSALVRGYLRSLVGNGAQYHHAGARTGIRESAGYELRRKRLREVLADFDARGSGVSERLTREEMYGEAANGPNALR